MPYRVEQRVRKWISDIIEGPEIIEVNEKILYLAERRFWEYQPTWGPYPDFMERLSEWLESTPDEKSQKALFKIVPHLFFVGASEFQSLYRTAFNSRIIPWIIDKERLTLLDDRLNEKLSAEIRATWFCPITDSMAISAFCHANKIVGHDHRPAWRSLGEFGDQGKILSYMQREQIKRIVLLEDFVGFGSQMTDAVNYITGFPSTVEIMLCPLLICPGGMDAGKRAAASNSNLKFSPVLPLEPAAFISANPIQGEHPLYAEIRTMLSPLYPLVTNGQTNENLQPYGSFGYGKVGGLVIMHTNCPDNSLPIIHHSSPSWNPLFPRSSRI